MKDKATNNDKCCICGKVLFINGERQTNLCYRFGLLREFIKENGWCSVEIDSEVFICKSCFSRNNNESIMRAIWKGHERSKKIRKQRAEE